MVEYSITAAYTALLLGCLMQENEENKRAVRSQLSSFSELALSLR